MLADNLVTKDQGQWPTEVAIRDVNVRVAHATGNDLDDFFTGSRGNGNLTLFQH